MKKYLLTILWKMWQNGLDLYPNKKFTSLKTVAINHPLPPVKIWVNPPTLQLMDHDLRDISTCGIQYWGPQRLVRHGWEMVNHHDVLIGLIHCSGCLCTRTNGRISFIDGSSRRLYWVNLEKLEEGRKKYLFIYFYKRQYINFTIELFH